jgi:hypothetical protein
MLHEGDRVRTCVPFKHHLARAIGTIRHVFRSVSETYSVQLDSEVLPCILPGTMLELLTDERERASGEER